jgi:hypothetical protein
MIAVIAALRSPPDGGPNIGEAREITGFGDPRRPGREELRDIRIGDPAGLAEIAERLRFPKAGEPHGLPVGGDVVRLLDPLLQRLRNRRRQAEPDVDRRLQPVLHRLVVAAEHRLERRDHVADDVFRRIVEERRDPVRQRGPRLLQADDALHQKAVLRHRESVVAGGLAVPARDARQPVRDVLELHV